MSELLSVSVFKDSGKNLNRAGHNLAEIGGGFLDQARAAAWLMHGQPEIAARRSWEGIGRTMSGVVGTVARTGLAVGEAAAASVILLPELQIHGAHEGMKATKRAIDTAVDRQLDQAVETRARKIAEETVRKELAASGVVGTSPNGRKTAAEMGEKLTALASAKAGAGSSDAGGDKAERSRDGVYQVKKGDSLWKIAEEAYKRNHDGKVDYKAVQAHSQALKRTYGETIHPNDEIVL